MLRHCFPGFSLLSSATALFLILCGNAVWAHSDISTAGSQSSATPFSTPQQYGQLHPQAIASDAQQQQAAYAHRQQRRQWVDATLASTQQDATATLQRLAAMARDDQANPTERDMALQQFATSLRQLRPEQVDEQILRWLARYQHQSWRSHEESEQLKMPVADVQAALTGTRNEWQYRAGQDSAWQLLNEQSTRQQLARYHRGSISFQRGLENQLVSMAQDNGQLANLERLWQFNRQQSDGIGSRLNGILALNIDHANGAMDLPKFRAWLEHSQHNGLQIMRQQAEQWPANTWFDLSFAFAEAQQAHLFGNTLALAVERWADLDADQQSQYRQQLYHYLGDRQLGSVAALQLVHITDAKTIARWQEQAQQSPQQALLQQRLALIAQRQAALATPLAAQESPR